LAACKVAGFDLIIVETSGIGQGDAAIVPLVDCSLYVMTPEFGAASQLEKIDMLDFADFVAINKFDRKGAEDALRYVRKQYQRNHERFAEKAEDMPVFGTMAARFNDDGVTALYQALIPSLIKQGLLLGERLLPPVMVKHSSASRAIVPPERVRYLAEIAECVRDYHRHVRAQAQVAHERQALATAKKIFAQHQKDATDFDGLIALKDSQLTPESRALLAGWPTTRATYAEDEFVVKVRGIEKRIPLTSESLSGTKIRKVVLPQFEDEGELLKFLLPSSGKTKTRPACSQVKAMRFAPIAGFIGYPMVCLPSACPQPLIQSRCMGAIRICARIFTAKSVIPAFLLRRWMT
jgi:methylmalonyl-CoA mutase